MPAIPRKTVVAAGPAIDVPFEVTRLRVLIANEEIEHLDLLAHAVTALGHEVIARETDVSDLAGVIARELPDVAFVAVGSSAQHALDLIGEIVHEAACPVIALLSAADAPYVREASVRGIFASVFYQDPDELQNAIDISLRRFADYHKLQMAFGRRALIEQAKGILMSRNSITADAAFSLLREHSARTSTKLVDVVAGVIASHGMFVLAPAPLTPPPA